MASRIDWQIIQSNQAQLSGQVQDDLGNAVNLTGLTLSLVIKASATATDASGTTYTPTVTNALKGDWSLTIAGTVFATAGSLWYRLDVVDGSSNHITSNYGQVSVVAS